MNILTEVKNSIYNTEYYKSLPSDKSLGSSIKYLAKLSLLVSLVSLVILSFSIPSGYRSIKETISSAVTNYPDDLVVSIKNGMASINKPEPYIVPISSKSVPESVKNEKNYHANILVIDTTKPFSSPQFETYSSFAWLTKTELVVIKDSNNQIQITPLPKSVDWQITKTFLREKEALVLKILPWGMLVLILLGYIVLFIANFVGTLIVLLLYAFVIWLMSKIAKRKLSYKDSYRIGIHAVTLLVIFSAFSAFLGFLDKFWIKLIIFIILVYINFFKDSSDKKEIE